MSAAFAMVPVVSTMAESEQLAGGKGGQIRVVATTGMVADLVERVGGGRVSVWRLMGAGVDPHLYKPTAGDTARLVQADAIFYNGLMLEGRMGEVLARLSRTGRRAYAVSEGIPRELLLEPPDFEGHFDPHVWFDVSLWARAVPVIVAGLSETDPDGARFYEKKGREVEASLAALHDWCLAKAGDLPVERRVLVTSHDAYNYFGRAYGFRVVGLQGVSTVSEAALADVASLVDFLKRERIPAIFVESSVNPEAMKRVAEDAGVRIGGELFSDALGERGEMRGEFDTGTYEGMIKYNMATIVEALK